MDKAIQAIGVATEKIMLVREMAGLLPLAGSDLADSLYILEAMQAALKDGVREIDEIIADAHEIT